MNMTIKMKLVNAVCTGVIFTFLPSLVCQAVSDGPTSYSQTKIIAPTDTQYSALGLTANKPQNTMWASTSSYNFLDGQNGVTPFSQKFGMSHNKISMLDVRHTNDKSTEIVSADSSIFNTGVELLSELFGNTSSNMVKLLNPSLTSTIKTPSNELELELLYLQQALTSQPSIVNASNPFEDFPGNSGANSPWLLDQNKFAFLSSLAVMFKQEDAKVYVTSMRKQLQTRDNAEYALFAPLGLNDNTPNWGAQIMFSYDWH